MIEEWLSELEDKSLKTILLKQKDNSLKSFRDLWHNNRRHNIWLSISEGREKKYRGEPVFEEIVSENFSM